MAVNQIKETVKKIKNSAPLKKATKEVQAYDETNVIKPVKLLLLVVNRGQGKYYLKKFFEMNVACAISTYGTGTTPREIGNILGVGETKKEIIGAIIKEADYPEIKKFIAERFLISKDAAGISMLLPVDSMVGVLFYKFITNTRQNRRKHKWV